MAESKWISGLSPRMSPVEAAVLVLSGRLDAVLHFLPLAAESAARDVEHVHQLRVATRRATAAVQLFADFLSDKSFRKMRNSLRAVRRAAGAARDWDVFYLQLHEMTVLQEASARPAFDFLIGVCAARRLEAQAALVEIVPEQETRLRTERKSLLDSGSFAEHSDRRSELGDLAGRRIALLIRELETAAAAAPNSYDELHQLRIVGKRLRYSMEIFADCFAPPFRDKLYPAVEKMQEVLGRITDAHVAAERVAQLRGHMKAFHGANWARYRKPVDRLLQSQRRIIPQERKRFHAWWQQWRELSSELPAGSLLVDG